MDRLTREVKYLVRNMDEHQKRVLKKRKIKVFFGKILFIYAALPLASAWAAIPAMMLVGIKPTLWARCKINDFKTWRRLR